MNQKIELFLANSKLAYTRKAGCLIFTEREFEQLYSRIVNECDLFCDNETMIQHMMWQDSRKAEEPILIGRHKGYLLHLSSTIFKGSGDFDHAQEFVRQIGDGEWDLPTLAELECISESMRQDNIEFSEQLFGAYWSKDQEGNNAWVGNFMNGGGMNPILTDKSKHRFIRAVSRKIP